MSRGEDHGEIEMKPAEPAQTPISDLYGQPTASKPGEALLRAAVYRVAERRGWSAQKTVKKLCALVQDMLSVVGADKEAEEIIQQARAFVSAQEKKEAYRG